jgi:hypothetical protein
MRKTRETHPSTYTVGDVVRILHGRIKDQALIDWDDEQIFRPTYYLDWDSPGGVILASVRDARMQSAAGRKKGPPRLYTFTDLVYLKLLIEVSERLRLGGATHARRRAGRIVSQIRDRSPLAAPHSSRVLVIGDDAYLLDEGKAECLTESKQLPLAGLFTDHVAAELRGCIDLLKARNELGHTEPIASEAIASA